jgi:hypothetical protein
MNLEFKQKVFNTYLNSVNEKIKLLHQTLDDLSNSIAEETKNSAGDKYETARALLQTEQSNVAKQLNDANDQKTLLKTIDINVVSEKIIKGSLIQTDKGYFFMSAGLGKVLVENETIIAFSQAAPLGQKINGLSIGDSAEINGIKYLIQKIY